VSAIASLTVIAGGAAWVYLVPFPEELLERDRCTPVEVLDRHGRVLRQGVSADGTRGRWVPLSEMSPWLDFGITSEWTSWPPGER
jgi:membrane peptidoglycan carboxypeptidase